MKLLLLFFALGTIKAIAGDLVEHAPGGDRAAFTFDAAAWASPGIRLTATGALDKDYQYARRTPGSAVISTVSAVEITGEEGQEGMEL